MTAGGDGSGRGPDAGRTIQRHSTETDADRTRTGRRRGRFSQGARKEALLLTVNRKQPSTPEESSEGREGYDCQQLPASSQIATSSAPSGTGYCRGNGGAVCARHGEVLWP
eukprot:gene17511-biopygen18892